MATIDDLIFTLNDDGAGYTVKAASSDISGAVVIPAEYEGLPVTAIAASGFFSGNLTSIEIPASVQEIGSKALYGCDGITSIAVAVGNPVYHSAGNCLIETATGTLLAGCQTSVIPDDDSVRFIANFAFAYQRYLQKISIPSSVYSIGELAFTHCTKLKSVEFPAETSILYASAFYSCLSLYRIIFEGDLIRQDGYVFQYTPAPAVIVFSDSRGWGETFAGKPVVVVPRGAFVVAFPGEFSFGNAAATATATVIAASADAVLSPTSSEDWIATSIDGGTLTISAAENTGEARSGTITVSAADGSSATLTVAQVASDSLLLSPTELSFDFAASSQTATITAGTATGTLSAETSADWLTATIDGTTLTISAAENTGAARSGTITVSGSGGGSATVSVSQGDGTATIIADPDSLSFEAAGGSEAVSLSASAAAGTLSATSSADWITATINGTTLTVFAAANTGAARSGTLTVSGSGGGSATVSVSQAADDSLTVSPTELSFGSSASSQTATITAGTATGTLSAETSGDWLTATIDGTTLTIEVAENSAHTARSGTITVSGSGGGSATLTVSQAGAPASITADPIALSFEAAGGSEVVSLSTSGDAGALSATASADWITATLREPLALVRALFDGAPVAGVGADLSFDGTATSATVAITGAGYANWQAGSYSVAGGYAYRNSANWILISDSGISWRGSWTLSFAVKSLSGQDYAEWDNIAAIGDADDHLRVQINSASSASGFGLFARRKTNEQETLLLQADNTFAAALSPDTWTLITLTYDYDAATGGASVALYADGVLIGQSAAANSVSWALPESASTVVALGGPASSTEGTRFVGLYDEPVLYDAAIAAAEIEDSLVNQTPPLALPGVVEISAAENTSTAARSGYVEVSGDAGAIPATIGVSQNGRAAAISASPTSLAFSAAGGTRTVSVVALLATTKWTATVSADWITISPASGTGSGTITVTAPSRL